MLVDIANKTMWTLYQEVNSASDAVNTTMGTEEENQAVDDSN